MPPSRSTLVAALLVVGGCLAAPEPKPLPDDWLRVEGGRIVDGSGRRFHGRGATLPDTRGCDSCTWSPAVPAEVERRIDALVDDWGANLVRVVLESYGESGGRVHYLNVLEDAGYLADLQRIVAHVGTKPGTYLILSLWIDPTLSSDGWPTLATHAVWSRLATTFAADGHVLFDIAESPESASDGAQDPALWQALDDTVAAIRAAEAEAGGLPHLIVVPGLSGSTRLDYFLDHPITAGEGRAIAYGVGAFVPESAFAERFVTPAHSLPVMVTEFAPIDPMTLADADALMVAAEAAEVPWLAWNFHMRCPPNLLVDNSDGDCGVGMALEATEWGEHVRARLAVPW